MPAFCRSTSHAAPPDTLSRDRLHPSTCKCNLPVWGASRHERTLVGRLQAPLLPPGAAGARSAQPQAICECPLALEQAVPSVLPATPCTRRPAAGGPDGARDHRFESVRAALGSKAIISSRFTNALEAARTCARMLTHAQADQFLVLMVVRRSMLTSLGCARLPCLCV